MAFVAEELGVDGPRDPAPPPRDLAAPATSLAIFRLARLIREQRPHILHTHTAKAGAIGRVAALLAGDARPPIVVHTFHGHVLRGYFDPLRARRLPRRSSAGSRRVDDALIAVSPEVRDDLVALGVAPRREVRRRSGSGSSSTSASPRADGGASSARAR